MEAAREIPETPLEGRIDLIQMKVTLITHAILLMLANPLPASVRSEINKTISEIILTIPPQKVFSGITGMHPVVQRNGKRVLRDGKPVTIDREIVVTDSTLIGKITGKEKEGTIVRAHEQIAEALGFSPLTIPLEEAQMDLWRKLYRAGATALQPKHVDKMVDQMQTLASDRIDQLAKQSDSQIPINILDATTEFTLQVLCKLTFGNLGSKDIDRIRPIWDTIKVELSRLLLMGKHGKPSALLKKAVAQLDKIVSDLIAAEKEKDVKEDHLLSKLIHPGEKDQELDEKEIQGMIKTFLFAGHETTSLSLGWISHFLATNHEVEKKLYAEIHEKLKEKGSSKNFKAEDYQALKYVEQVIKEALRLRPTLWAVAPRRATKDVVIDGYQFRENDLIALVLIKDQTDEKIWGEDAKEFKPERWKNLTEQQKGAYMPFYTGMHSCPGEHLAMQEMLCWLVLMVEKGIKLEEVETPKEYGLLTLDSSNGINMRVTKWEGLEEKTEQQAA